MSRVLAALVTVPLLVLGLVDFVGEPAHAAAPTTGRFTAVNTTRVWQGQVGTAVTPIQIAGRGGVPANATAVVVNVEVSNPTEAGYVRVTPAGRDAQVATQVFAKGRTISNLATVRLVDGKIQTKLSQGSARLFFDVSGFYSNGTASTYTALPNARVFGGRIGTTPVRVPITGRGGVPSDATAVAVTAGLEQQTDAGYLRVTPAGHDAQVASQTFPPNTAISGLVIARLQGGALQAKVSRGSAQLWMDVAGYYSSKASGAVFVPLDTTRAHAGALSTAPTSVRLSGVAGVPGNAVAVVANVEVSNPTDQGYVRVTPNGQDAQVASQAFAAGQSVSNLTMTKVTGSSTDRRVQAKVSRGTSNVFFDVSGYFTDGTPAAPRIGYDLSWPQCDRESTWPSDRAFAVIGVNGGLANNSNPCFADQLAWAEKSSGGTSQPKVQLYVNTGNPGTLATVWPTSNRLSNGTTVRNPHGTCTGKVDAACSYMYGYTRAWLDATARGVGNPAAYRWWLDIEIDNSWQTDKRLNIATLEAMTAYFRSIGAPVGLYSAPSHWTQLFGTVSQSSNLRNLPSWYPIGAGNVTLAQQACSRPGLTGGKVQMVQWIQKKNGVSLDHDISCV